MLKQKLVVVATGALVFGFLAGNAPYLLAQLLRPSEANIRIVAGMPEVPRDENGHPLGTVKSGTVTMLLNAGELKLVKNGTVMSYVPARFLENRAGLTTSPTGGLAHPGHPPPLPDHCYVVVGGIEYPYHCYKY